MLKRVSRLPLQGVRVCILMVGVILISACAAAGSSPTIQATFPPQPSISPTAEWTQIPSPQLTTYRSEAYGFEFQYSQGAPLTEVGTGVRIDLPIVPGTTLVEKFLEVQVTSPSPQVCSSPQNIGRDPAAVQAETITLNGLDFRKEVSGGVATGNLYEFTAYNLVHDGSCISLTFTLHYTDPANYVSPPPEFDRAVETAVFEQIMNTFSILQ